MMLTDKERETCKIDNSIPLMEFGNKYKIRGILFSDDETNKGFIASLPSGRDTVSTEFINPSTEEWFQIFEQQDYHFVKGELNGEKVILRKSQRNIDQVIMWKVFRRDNFKCRYCGIDHVPMTVDHIITWETGGATHVDNLLCTCKKCNNARGNMPYDEFLKSDYYAKKFIYLSSEAVMANNRILNNLENLPRAKKRKR